MISLPAPCSPQPYFACSPCSATLLSSLGRAESAEHVAVNEAWQDLLGGGGHAHRHLDAD